MSRNRQTAYFVAGCTIILLIMIVFATICLDVEGVYKNEISTEPIESTTVVTVGTIVTTPPETIPPETSTPETIAPTEPLKPNFKVIEVPEKYQKRSIFKSYEDYRLITSTNTPHYKLQNSYAYTGKDGVRMVNGRYCIALGSYFEKTIGQYIDIVLANGTVIECILGDQKSDAHTAWPHVAHGDGSVVEFIIDKKVMDPYVVRTTGNVSDLYDEWKSPVVQVIVYEINYFDTVS